MEITIDFNDLSRLPGAGLAWHPVKLRGAPHYVAGARTSVCGPHFCPKILLKAPNLLLDFSAGRRFRIRWTLREHLYPMLLCKVIDLSASLITGSLMSFSAYSHFTPYTTGFQRWIHRSTLKSGTATTPAAPLWPSSVSSICHQHRLYQGGR